MPAARIGDQTRKKRENGVTRDVVFKMERPGLVEVGQTVEVTESVTPFNVNYIFRINLKTMYSASPQQDSSNPTLTVDARGFLS